MNIPDRIEVPAATAWPIVLAFGMTLVFAGFVTAVSVSILGAILAVAGAVGWFREVLPVESLEWAPVVQEEIAIETSRESVEHVTDVRRISRAWLPIEIYPISAGIKGGLAGGAAMALLAGLYGIVSGNGIWYPVNLLAAMVLPGIDTMTEAQLEQFSLPMLLTGMVIHAAMSVVFGLLYGVLLPTLPGNSLAWGGVLFPVFWSSVSYCLMGVVNPVLQARVDWFWPSLIVATLYFPGSARTSAISSCTLVAGTEGCTSRTDGEAEAIPIGAKLLMGSY